MKNAATVRPYILTNRIQPYEWGARGKQAFIPNLLGIAAEEDKPYAELWMGTHPAAPSMVAVDGKLTGLKEMIEKFPVEILGQTVYERFGANLPFLFKVLSAGQALSIQAHPNKVQAVQLHAKDSAHYPDPNHKPEIAVALDELTVLIGLPDLKELSKRLALYSDVQRFAEITLTDVNIDSNESGEAIIEQFFSNLLRKSSAESRRFGGLIAALETDFKNRIGSVSESERLFLDLRKIYPVTDIGLIMALFMNLVHLKAGQAVFIAAGIPHAYVSGNIIECMANSDNVVRVGLTNKFKDVPALLEILDYSKQTCQVMNPESRNGIKIYPTPVEEFYIRSIHIDRHSEKRINTDDRVQICLILIGQVDLVWNNGEALALQKGQSVMIPAAVNTYDLRSQNGAEVFIASVN